MPRPAGAGSALRRAHCPVVSETLHQADGALAKRCSLSAGGVLGKCQGSNLVAVIHSRQPRRPTAGPHSSVGSGSSGRRGDNLYLDPEELASPNCQRMELRWAVKDQPATL